MEIIVKKRNNETDIKAVLFDFDGTLSTLRFGWEKIMEPLMLEMITGNREPDSALIAEVREYIDRSTGVQTYYQMEWLAEAVVRHGRNIGAPADPWWYKAEYNRRLMEPVRMRIASIQNGKKKPSDFLMAGSEDFLKALTDRGIKIYVASGTDDPDVNNEAKVLGLSKYFSEVSGAPPGRAECSKEAVLRRLIGDFRLQGNELAVIGDGKVEIALGREVGAITLGIASDEENRTGINMVKRERLIKAGANAIVGDFIDRDLILSWMGIE